MYIQAAKINRPDGPGPVESRVGPTFLSLYRPDVACSLSGQNTGKCYIAVASSNYKCIIFAVKILCTEQEVTNSPH